MYAVLLARADSYDDLHLFSAVEENQPEGALIGVEMAFHAPADDIRQLADQLNAACLEQGVAPWPGTASIVYTEHSTIRICWTKGFAWWPIILGTLLALVLPMLIGAVLWALTPEPVKQAIGLVVTLGVVMFVMYGVSKVTKRLEDTP